MAQATVVKNIMVARLLKIKERHDYFIEEKFEAGMSLQGWEVNFTWTYDLSESYVIFKNGEAFYLVHKFSLYYLHQRMWFLNRHVHVSYYFSS
jgi:tmRNA-binding protein